MSGRFGDLVFDDGFLTATRAGGEVVRFTRRERALLEALAGNPGRLFTRAALFEALEGRGSDRNVDFVINRLRAKLGDSGPERRFISTQYGEGYVWVAGPGAADDGPVFFALAPARGVEDERACVLIEALSAALGAHLGAGHRVAPVAEANGHARFRIEPTLHAASGRLHAAFLLRDGPTGAAVTTLRDAFAEGAPPVLAPVAAALVDAAWKHVALPPASPTPTDPPLHLRLHAAAMLLDPTGKVRAANADRIRALREADPADPMLALVWAMHRFGQVTVGANPVDAESEAAFADEVEGLVMGALPHVRRDPMLALAAAKLLLAIHRGHDALAEDLTNDAFAEGAAFAAALPMLAQIRSRRGDLAGALRLFDQTVTLCEPGSAFEAYLQVLRATVQIAMDDRPAAEATYDRLAAISPDGLAVYALQFLPPDDGGLARRLAPLADRVTEDVARRMIAYSYYRVARYFGVPAHAANIMRGPLVHFVRRFGPGVAPDDVWRAMPAELRYLRRAGRAVVGNFGDTA